MDAPKEPDKCMHCIWYVLKDDEEHYLCALCNDFKYCSDECRKADLYVIHLPSGEVFLIDCCISPIHRGVCTANEAILAIDEHCAVCRKEMEVAEERCKKCGSIPYCSTRCKDGDK
jgi:hypothetical protein